MIFIDSGAFIARFLRRDQHHAEAQAFWAEITRREDRCFTSNFVLDEVLTFLGRTAGNRVAVEKVQAIYRSPVFTVLRPEAADEVQALNLFEKFADQRVSFTDCVSFVLMRNAGLQRAFSFDWHFRLAGFTPLPGMTVHEPPEAPYGGAPSGRVSLPPA